MDFECICLLALESHAVPCAHGVDVTLHPHTGIDLATVWDELEYEHYTLQAPSVKLPLHVFEAQPVVGKRITMLNLQLENDHEISLVITGHTWPFRSRLDSFGISGGYSEHGANQENGTRKYYRVWKNIDVTEEAQQERFFDMLSNVFKNVVMRVSLDRNPEPDTYVAAFVERFRKQTSLHFSNKQNREVAIPPNKSDCAAVEPE